MRKTVVFIVLLFLTLTNSFAQKYLVLKNGTRINSKDYALYKDTVYFRFNADGDTHSDNIREIVGSYEDDHEVMNYSTYHFDSVGNKNVHLFMPRRVSGKINVYEGPAMQQGSVYYIEKGEKFIRGGSWAMEAITKEVKKLVADEPVVFDLIKNEKRASFEELFSVIRKYNVIDYDRNPPPAAKDSIEVSFYIYSRLPAEVRARTPIEIGGRATSITMNTILTVKIPNRLTKVCFGKDKADCDLIAGSPFFTAKYELAFDRSTKPPSIVCKKLDKDGVKELLRAMTYERDKLKGPGN